MRLWQGIGFTDMGELDALARRAEALGYHGVTLGDHWVTAQTQVDRYGYSGDGDGKVGWTSEIHWPDPWVQFAALAKLTESLQFMTTVYVLPMRDVFSAAKAISTAAVIAQGRVHLGVGVGWQGLEFSLSGQPFHRRGRHVDEQLAVLRKLWSGKMAEHHGDFYDFDPLQMTPPPPAEIPIYIGGESAAAFRRAARHDGWVGAVYPFEAIEGHVASARRARLEVAGNLDGFRIVAGCFEPSRERLERLAEIGVTDYLKPPWTDAMQARRSDLSEKLEEMERFAETHGGVLS